MHKSEDGKCITYQEFSFSKDYITTAQKMLVLQCGKVEGGVCHSKLCVCYQYENICYAQVWIRAIRRLSCAIYGSTICAIICGLRTQSMDYTVCKAWINTIHGLFCANYGSMDCTYVPCAKYGLELRCIHNGGSTLCTRAAGNACTYQSMGGLSGTQRRATTHMHAFATDN